MNVLLIAYYFPPDSSSGAFRPLFFANHLNAMGIDVHVLTARVEDYLEEQTVDKKLLSSLSEEVRITRASVRRPREALIKWRDRLFGGRKRTINYGSSAPKETWAGSKSFFQEFKDGITDLLGTPDPQVGWIPDCIRKGREIIERETPSVIFATGGPWSGMLAAARLSKSTGVPLVLDFRDPWASNPARAGRSTLCRYLDRKLEKYVVSSAVAIVANTEELRLDFLRKCPHLRGDRLVTITNGFEEYLPLMEKPSRKKLIITHTGELYYSRNPANLLQALQNLIESGVVASKEITLRIVGGINVADCSIDSLLNTETIKGSLELIPRVPYRESIRYTQESDVLLLIQPNFPLQVPRKLFEYVAARKPLLCISERESATTRIVEREGLGYVCDNEVESIEASLRRIVKDWRDDRLSDLGVGSMEIFLNRNLTVRLKDVFSAVTSSPMDAS